MITENLSTLKIHKLTKEQYNRELQAGRIDENALYLTEEGNSSVVGDIETNESLSDYTMVSGTGNIAGMKGFRIVYQEGVDGGNGFYALDSVEGLEVGDVYSVRHSWSAIDRGAITAIDTSANTVTVDNYFDKSLITEEDVAEDGLTLDEYLTLYPWRNSFSINAKPTIGTIKIGVAATAEGRNNQALRVGSHVEGNSNIAIGEYSHVEGQSNTAGHVAHAEGRQNIASGEYSHAEGKENVASGFASHAEGLITNAAGDYSHAEGWESKAFGNHSHAEGVNTRAHGTASHAQNKSIAYGDYSHAEGRETQAGRQGNAETYHSAHSEGWETKAWGVGSHAEGYQSRAEGRFSHAEGYNTHALGENSHAEGHSTSAHWWGSHAEGEGTVTTTEYQHVQGKYNDPNTGSECVHVIGWGTAEEPKNIHYVRYDGSAWFASDIATNTNVAAMENVYAGKKIYINDLEIFKNTSSQLQLGTSSQSTHVGGNLTVNAGITANNGHIKTGNTYEISGGYITGANWLKTPKLLGKSATLTISVDNNGVKDVAKATFDNNTMTASIYPANVSNSSMLGTSSAPWTNIYAYEIGSCYKIDSVNGSGINLNSVCTYDGTNTGAPITLSIDSWGSETSKLQCIFEGISKSENGQTLIEGASFYPVSTNSASLTLGTKNNPWTSLYLSENIQIGNTIITESQLQQLLALLS